MPVVKASPTAKPSLLPTTSFQYIWTDSLTIAASTNVVVSTATLSDKIGVVSSNAKSGQLIYLGSISGSTWTPVSSLSSPPNGWASIEVSSSGQYISVTTGPACTTSYSQVQVSSDYGITWKVATGLPNICNGRWKTIYSQDVQNMYAIALSGVSKLYRSTNQGLTWTILSNSLNDFYYSGIVTSITGKNVTALNKANLYYSHDYGTTWLKTSPPFYNCGQSFSLAGSSTGQLLVVVSPCGSVVYGYISNDYGKKWKSIPTVTMKIFPFVISLSVSSTGQYIAASFQANGIYVSTDFGINWSLQSTSSVPASYTIAMTGSGNIIVAGTSSGEVYIGKSPLVGIP